MSKNKQRLEDEEFNEKEFYKLRKANSWTKYKHNRRTPNWKRLWLDHPNDFESFDEFFSKRT